MYKLITVTSQAVEAGESVRGAEPQRTNGNGGGAERPQHLVYVNLRNAWSIKFECIIKRSCN